MINRTRINLSTDFKIFLIIMLVGAIMLKSLSIPDILSYRDLRIVADTLPAYSGKGISSGREGREDCYGLENSHTCNSLKITVKNEDTVDADIAQFIQATNQQGVMWTDYEVGDRMIDSDVFEREGKKYQIYIYYNIGDGTNVSLLKY